MISAVILAKNEGKNIEDCIESVSFCDEIIVIDDHSLDKTKELAQNKKAFVYTRELLGDFSDQRNFGLEKAKGDWILFIDADERVSKDLGKEILTKIANTSGNGFYVKRFDFMNGKMLKHGETAHIQLLRIVRKGNGKWEGAVHETLHVKGSTEVLKSPLLHYPHQTIAEFLDDINFYTDIRAHELYKKKIKVHWYDMVFYPKAKFIRNYVIKEGYKDGVEGVIMALMMSFHSFLVRGKLWQLWDQKTSSQ